MSMIEQIISTITGVTGSAPVIKGGNRRNPIEYELTRNGVREYQMALYLHGSDLLQLLATEDKIVNAIVDFGDLNPLGNGSVEMTPGGQFVQDNIITEVLYFDIIDYKTNVDPWPTPQGTIIITDNGEYDVAPYARASVSVSGGDTPHYQGEYEITPRKTEQVLATRNTILDDDVTIYQIPYSSVVNPEGGYTVTIGIE